MINSPASRLLVAIACAGAFGFVSGAFAGPNGGGAGGQGAGGPGARGQGGANRDPMQMAQRMIEQFDKNGDQALNAQELATAMQQMRQQRGQGGQGAPGQGARGQRPGGQQGGQGRPGGRGQGRPQRPNQN